MDNLVFRPPGGDRPLLAGVSFDARPGEAVAVIGASSESGKIGNSVMKNLINGGYRGSRGDRN